MDGRGAHEILFLADDLWATGKFLERESHCFQWFTIGYSQSNPMPHRYLFLKPEVHKTKKHRCEKEVSREDGRWTGK